MNIENLVSVSALPGLHKIIANRDNGLIVENLETGKTRFCSSRKHQFSPMETIAIFTDDDDSEKLEVIFQTMMDQKGENPIPAPNGASDDLKSYFEKILPNYDKDKVHVSHIKKVIKWYNQLDKSGLLAAEAPKKDEKDKVKEKKAMPKAKGKAKPNAMPKANAKGRSKAKPASNAKKG